MSLPPKVRWRDALNGAAAGCDNAERLCKDAILLLNKGSVQTSFAVAIIAWEETNKAGMLLKSYVEETDISETQWKKKYQSHTYKLQAYPQWADVLSEGSKKPDKGMVVKLSSEVGKRYDLEKQLLGFYVDNHTAGWSTPNDLSEQEERYLYKMTSFWIDTIRITVATVRHRIEMFVRR